MASKIKNIFKRLFHKNKKDGVAETFVRLREIGSSWNDTICVCRELMRDDPCYINCKEFFDESLANSFKERTLTQTTKASEVNESEQSDIFEQWKSITRNGDYKE